MIPRALLVIGVSFVFWSMFHASPSSRGEKLLKEQAGRGPVLLPSRRRLPEGDGTYPS